MRNPQLQRLPSPARLAATTYLVACSTALAHLSPPTHEPAPQPRAEAGGQDEVPAGSFRDGELTPQDYDEQASAKPGHERRVEEQAGTEPEDVYLFLPRAVLYLPNLALKTLFFPVQKTAEFVDEYHVVQHVRDTLYNDARTAGVVPVFGYQSSYGISGGAKAFHDDLLRNQEHVSVSAEYGGLYQQAYKFSFEADELAHSRFWLEAHARYEVKPGLRFWGLGNRSELSESTPDEPVAPRELAVETRFREQRYMASLLVGQTLTEHDQRTQVGVLTLYNRRRFGRRSNRFSDPPIEDVYDTSMLTGYAAGTEVIESGPVFMLDSRDTEVLTSRGAYFDTFAAYARPRHADAGYWHYGVTGAGFIDLYGGSRVLSLRAVLEAVHGDSDDIPFTELMRLGGPERLRGYGLDRFRDKLSLVATAEYRYPIHDLVAGELFVDAGRVGDSYPNLFSVDKIDSVRVGGGLGLVFHDQEQVLFKAQAAYGEELLFFLSSDPLAVFQERHKRL